MIEIKTLAAFDESAFLQIATGYTTDSRYIVGRIETPERVEMVLELVKLTEPKTVVYTHEPEQMQIYHETVGKGYSLGAYHEGQMVGIALADCQYWNNSLWVWEFHIMQSYRGQGIGLNLMQRLTDRAVAENIRVIVCETQTTNVPAIRFYRKAGFQMDGIDLSYYTNTDVERHDVAVFMKKRLP